MRTRHACLAVVALLLVGSASSAKAAGQHPPTSRAMVRALDMTADHPLTTFATYTGQVDAAVLCNPQDGTSAPSGTFSLAGLPAGATIQAALLVVSHYGALNSPTVTFAGTGPTAVAPTYTDPGYPYDTFRVDVKSLVTGNGNYTYAMTGLEYCYGAALVVVYSHPSLATRQIVVNTGAEDLQNASSATSFAGFTTAGSGRLLVFTGADDPNTDVGESLAFNGTAIPGVIFSQNLGPVTSLTSQTVPVVAGTNTATVTTGLDQFGISLAVLVGPAEAVYEKGIPSLSAAGLGLFALAVAGVGVALALRRGAIA